MKHNNYAELKISLKFKFLFQIVLLLQVEMVQTPTLSDATSVTLPVTSSHLHHSTVRHPDWVLVLTFLQGSSR